MNIFTAEIAVSSTSRTFTQIQTRLLRVISGLSLPRFMMEPLVSKSMLLTSVYWSTRPVETFTNTVDILFYLVFFRTIIYRLFSLF